MTQVVDSSSDAQQSLEPRISYVIARLERAVRARDQRARSALRVDDPPVHDVGSARGPWSAALERTARSARVHDPTVDARRDRRARETGAHPPRTPPESSEGLPRDLDGEGSPRSCSVRRGGDADGGRDARRPRDKGTRDAPRVTQGVCPLAASGLSRIDLSGAPRDRPGGPSIETSRVAPNRRRPAWRPRPGPSGP